MEAEYYTTSDMDLASYLMTVGRQVKIFSSGQRLFYQFEHLPGLQADITTFLNDTPVTIKPRTFAEHLRRLRIALAIDRRGGKS